MNDTPLPETEPPSARNGLPPRKRARAVAPLVAAFALCFGACGSPPTPGTPADNDSAGGTSGGSATNDSATNDSASDNTSNKTSNGKPLIEVSEPSGVPLARPCSPPATAATAEKVTNAPACEGMTNVRLGQLLKESASAIDGQAGQWKLKAFGQPLLVLTDTKHDRMRIVSPVVEASALTASQIGALLVANFHTALDARYAVHDGVLYAAFIHPLSPLSDDEVRSAIKQVATLANNFGTSYSSGALIFGASP